MIAVTAIILMVNAAAPVEDDATRAKAAFQAAQKLYKQARYPDAIEKFEEANRLKPHPSIFFNIGRCYEQLNEIGKALRNYREYVKAMPDAKDKDLVNDAIANLEKRLKDQGVQQLLVFTDPNGGTVTVDGKKIGMAPSATELKPGNHSLSVTLDGYETVERGFVMPADKSMELSFALKVGKGKSTAPAETPPVAKTTDLKGTGEVRAEDLPPPPPTPPPAVVAETSTSTSSGSGSGLRGKAWIIPTAAGGLLLIGGGVFYGMAKGTEGRLRNGDTTVRTPGDRIGLAGDGSSQQTIGFVLGGVGIAAVVAGVVMAVLPSKPAGTSVSFIATPNMAAAMVSGEFP